MIYSMIMKGFLVFAFTNKVAFGVHFKLSVQSVGQPLWSSSLQMYVLLDFVIQLEPHKNEDFNYHDPRKDNACMVEKQKSRPE